jgi:hypothetical protein
MTANQERVYLTKFSINKTIINRIPRRASPNNKSAMVSNRLSLFSFSVLIEIKENKQENISNTAMAEVNSSMILVTE